MRTSLKLTVMLAAVLMFAACDKTNEALTHERVITYRVAENTKTVHLKTDQEFDALLEKFCDYAESGRSVTFYNANRATTKTATKKTETYSTTDREKMTAWMRRMEADGKTVTVTYDQTTNTWHGTAYATAPQTMSGAITYINIQDEELGNTVPAIIVTIDTLNNIAYVNYNPYDDTVFSFAGGVFHNVYRYNDDILVLGTPKNREGGRDTLYISSAWGGDTVILGYIHTGWWPADRSTHCFMIPAPQGLQTWYCSSPYDVILNIFPDVIETYPEIGIAQICAPMAEYINCIVPFWSGNCEMIRYYTSRTDVDWELSLRYTYNNDSSYSIFDSLGVSGYPSDANVAIPMVIHDLRQHPSYASQYVFNKIN